jgi:hypothetical protein
MKLRTTTYLQDSSCSEGSKTADSIQSKVRCLPPKALLVEQREILACPLPIKHAFAFASEFSTVRGFRKCIRSEGLFCNLFKSQLRIFPSVVIELTDYFDLREG